MIEKSKNTEFGVLLSLLLAVIELLFEVNLLLLVIVSLLLALLVPKVYSPFTWFWIKLGEGLGFMINRCILFLLFFLIISPIAYIRRRMGKDPFYLKQFGKCSGSVFIRQEKTYNKHDLDQQY